jgi:hypothetical protein
LGSQQPEHYQSGVNAVIAFGAAFGQGLIQKVEREKFLKSRREIAEGGFRNEWRERECWSCVKPGYREKAKATSVL